MTAPDHPAGISVIRWAGASDVGLRRTHNEDSWGVYVFDRRMENAAERGATAMGEQGMLFVVSDGIGGAQAGEVASEFCVRRLAEEAFRRAARTAEVAMQEAIVATHGVLAAEARTKHEWVGMGATLSALWLLPHGRAVLGHVGDSRIYVFRERRLCQLTEDHSVGAGMVRRSEITAEASARLRFRSMLEQSMGGDGQPLEPQVVEFAVNAGDVFLLCSDGLHGLVSAGEMEAIVRPPEADLAKAAEALVAKANEAGGPDNITVVLARVSPA